MGQRHDQSRSPLRLRAGSKPRLLRSAPTPLFPASCRPCNIAVTRGIRSHGAPLSPGSEPPGPLAGIGRPFCERLTPGSPTSSAWRSHTSAPFPGSLPLTITGSTPTHNGRVEPSELDLSQLLSWGSVNPDDAGSSAPVNQFANRPRSSRDRRGDPRHRTPGLLRPRHLARLHVPPAARPALHTLDRHDPRELPLRRKRRGDDHGSDDRFRPLLQRAVLRSDDGSSARRIRARKPARCDRDVRRPRAPGAEIILERLASPGGRRLQQLATADRRRSHRQSEQRGSRDERERSRRRRRRQCDLAVQRRGHGRVSPGDPGRRELLRPSGVSDPLLRRSGDARHARQLPSASDRLGRDVSHAERLRASTSSSRATSASGRGSRSRRRSPSSTSWAAAPSSPATAASASTTRTCRPSSRRTRPSMPSSSHSAAERFAEACGSPSRLVEQLVCGLSDAAPLTAF